MKELTYTQLIRYAVEVYGEKKVIKYIALGFGGYGLYRMASIYFTEYARSTQQRKTVKAKAKAEGELHTLKTNNKIQAGHEAAEDQKKIIKDKAASKIACTEAQCHPLREPAKMNPDHMAATELPSTYNQIMVSSESDTSTHIFTPWLNWIAFAWVHRFMVTRFPP